MKTYTKVDFFIAFFIGAILIYFLTGAIALFMQTGIKTFALHYSYETTYLAFIQDYSSLSKAFLISLLVVAPIVTYPFYNHNFKNEKNLYGDASFANKREIEAMGLLSGEGIIIGSLDDKSLLRFNEEKFIALAAPTGSGKGIGFVIPNLLSWVGSAVVLDIKKENFNLTSKFRKYILGQEIYIHEPFSYKTHRFNPLWYVDMNDLDYRDSELSAKAALLYPTTGDAEKDFWPINAKSLFMGYCYLCHDLLSKDEAQALLEEMGYQPSFSLPGILDLALNFNIETEDAGEELKIIDLNELLQFLDEEAILSIHTKKAFAPYLKIEAEETRTSVFASFAAPLQFFYENRVIRNATSGNDFDLREVRKKKMTIYLVIQPGKVNELTLYLKLFWSVFFDLNTREEMKANPDLKHECLAMMDEFTAPGYLKVYLKSVAYIRSFGIKSLIIYQSDSQIEAPVSEGGYGKTGAETLLANHTCKMYYTPDNEKDAKSISQQLGYKTVKDKSSSINSSRGILDANSGSRSISHRQRALMLPQEIMLIPDDELIIRIAGKKPIFAKKAIYFKNKELVNRLKSVSPTLRSKKGFPNKDDYDKAVSLGELAVLNENLNLPKKEENA
jgi:type IV secretion system protein VirD4